MTNVTGASAWLRCVCILYFAFCILQYNVHIHAQQQLVDRVLARVGTSAVTLTDVRAALGFGLIEVRPGEDSDAVALQRAIDRQLLLDEVARFPPPMPSAEAVAGEVAAMKSRAGGDLDGLLASTGLDDETLQERARDTLRVRAYVAQRFGTAAQVTEDEGRKYYDGHPDEFTRNGTIVPFEEAEATARQRASAERLQTTIDRWIGDLRMRAEVVIVGRP